MQPVLRVIALIPAIIRQRLYVEMFLILSKRQENTFALRFCQITMLIPFSTAVIKQGNGPWNTSHFITSSHTAGQSFPIP